MRPEDLLAASRESMGPDVDARTRLMGRLAALGPPGEAAAPKRRIWPWVVATTAVAAAVVALWGRPDSQRLVDTSGEVEQASDQASSREAGGVALPKAPATARQTRKDATVEPPLVPERVQTSRPEPATRGPKPQRTPAKPRNRPGAEAPVVQVPAPLEPDASETLAAEAALISRARGALSRGNAADALKHLREYETRFAAPHLAEEAAALRAMARCAAEGRDDERAAAFGREFPRSMLRKRVRRACAVDAEAE